MTEEAQVVTEHNVAVATSPAIAVTHAEQAPAPAIAEDAPSATDAPASTEAKPQSNLIAPSVEESQWYLSEGVSGEGEKPDWFYSDKYKSVADQAKAHSELRKKLGGFTGAPNDGYALHIDEKLGEVGISAEDPMLLGFAEVAREANMSQETFDKVVNNYVARALAMNSHTTERNTKADQEHFATEIEQLGPDFKQDREVLQQWFINNFGADNASVMEDWVQTAADFKLMQKIKEKFVGSPLPKQDTPMPTDRIRLREMMNDSRYGRDHMYTRSVDDAYKTQRS